MGNGNLAVIGMTLVLSVFVAMASVTVSAIVVNFPDPGLEAAIRDAIGQPIGDIHDTDLLGLTSLMTQSIVNLEGIQYCTGLMRLWLFGNKIRDISALSNLTKLANLYLSGDQIVDINALSNLANLTDLSLRGKHIVDISALSSLTKLTRLDLDGNQIVDISALSGLTKLTRLDLDNNQIVDISSLSGLINLKWLGLGDNQIIDISTLSGLINLEWLWLAGNKIYNIRVLASLTKLTWLSLGSNQIVDISALSGLASLTKLDLSNNQVRDILPFVNSVGINSGDNVDVRWNHLALILGSTDMQDIQVLINRGVTVIYKPQNPHTANAGPDQTVVLGHSVQLDGSESNNPDGISTTYAWEIVSSPNGDTIVLLNPDTINSTFAPDIAGQYITNLTVDYGNGETDSDTVLIIAVEAEELTITLSPAGWHMITLPGNLWVTRTEDGSEDLTCALSDNLDPCYVFYYNPEIGSYVIAPPSENIPYRAGMGFWIDTYVDDVTIDVVVQVATEVVEIPLQKGWNQIGDPFTFSVAVNTLKVRCEDTELSLTDAQVQGWVSAYLLGYDTESHGYMMIDSTTGCLQPWKGYWIRFYQDSCVLIIPPTECSSLSSVGRPMNLQELKAKEIELPPSPPRLKITEPPRGTRLKVDIITNPGNQGIWTVKIEGQGMELVRAIQLLIYNLAEEQVFAQEINARELECHMVDDTGALLANGIYFYQVWLKFASGWYRARMDKMVILR